MPDEVIEYKSGKAEVHIETDVLETSTTKGLKCVWSGKTDDDCEAVRFSWKFDWDELKKEGVDGLTGRLVLHYDSLPTKYSTNTSGVIKIDVNLNENNNIVKENIHKFFKYNVDCHFELTLKLHRFPTQTLNALPSKNDTIIVIGKKEINVNKAFLSRHSEYFRDLFSSNNKGSYSNKYTIRNVSSKDFELLLDTLHSKIVISSDEMAEKLLKLGSRFKMTSQIPHVEHFLKSNSKLGNAKMMEMADKYGLTDLLKECINRMNTMQKADNLKRHGQYANFSVETKAKIFMRLMQILKVSYDDDDDDDDDDSY